MIAAPDTITTDRFLLRSLSEQDATERYLRWLRERSAREFIAAATKTEKLTDLKEYIRERVGRADVIFLGIFDKTSGMHIGNIKYEPINLGLEYAVMGVLIGEPEYRYRGVTPEVLVATADWLKQHRHIKQILLGVDKENTAAIRAYEKVGFVIAKTPYIKQTSLRTVTMIWQL